MPLLYYLHTRIQMAEGSNDKIQSRYSKDGQQDKLQPNNPLYSSQVNPNQGQEDSHRDPPDSPHTLHSQHLGYGLCKACDVHGSCHTLRKLSPCGKNTATFAPRRVPPKSSHLPKHIEESNSASNSSSENHGDHGIYAPISHSTPLTHPHTWHNCHQSNQHDQWHQEQAQQHPSVTLKQSFRLVSFFPQ